jgi:hypothetical protein
MGVLTSALLATAVKLNHKKIHLNSGGGGASHAKWRKIL